MNLNDVVLAGALHAKPAKVLLPDDWDLFYLGCAHAHPADVVGANLVRFTEAVLHWAASWH